MNYLKVQDIILLCVAVKHPGVAFFSISSDHLLTINNRNPWMSPWDTWEIHSLVSEKCDHMCDVTIYIYMGLCLCVCVGGGGGGGGGNKIYMGLWAGGEGCTSRIIYAFQHISYVCWNVLFLCVWSVFSVSLRSTCIRIYQLILFSFCYISLHYTFIYAIDNSFFVLQAQVKYI